MVNRLKGVFPDSVANSADILGVSWRARPRGNSKKETDRINKCLTVIRLLACIRLPFQRLLSTIGMFAVSKASYGWLSRAMPWTVSKSIWSAFARASQRMRYASPWLRGALWGGKCHPDIVLMTRLVGMLARLRKSRQLVWSLIPGHPIYTLHCWLKKRGWRLLEPLVWKSNLSGDRLSLRDVPWKVGNLQHCVRHGWRAWMVKQHSLSSRRDASSVDAFLPFRSINNVDWEKIRGWTCISAEARSIACGAELTARFGWVMEGQYDANQIHAWLIIAQARIWQIHHDDLTE